MNITQENANELVATLKIQLTEEDYKTQVEKAMKDLQKKAQMPGFRPGKVPMGMVNKLYGKSVKVEEVNKILVDAVYDFVKEKELNILGNPLPDHEKAAQIDWDKQTDFEFFYEIGMAPEIKLNLSEEIDVDYHKIVIPDTMIDDYTKDLRRRYGKMINPEETEAEDVIKGEFAELDGSGNVIEEGLKNSSNLYIQYLKDDETKEKMIGLKAGDSVDLDIIKSVGNEAEMASMLGVTKEDLQNYGKDYKFTVETISRVEPAEMDEEFFKKVSPEKELQSEDELREFLREQLSKQYQTDADKDFRNEAIKRVVEKTNLSLPEDFLKRWLLESNRDNQEITEEKIENEFDSFIDSFKWQLIENHLIKEYKIEVSNEEVTNYLKDFMRAQLRQYGQLNPDDETLNSFVQRVVSNKEELKKIYDQLFDVKILELFKKEINLNEKEVTFDEFVKIMTEKYNQGNKQEA